MAPRATLEACFEDRVAAVSLGWVPESLPGAEGCVPRLLGSATCSCPELSPEQEINVSCVERLQIQLCGFCSSACWDASFSEGGGFLRISQQTPSLRLLARI